MPSTYSPALRLTLMADGEDANTWGDIANTVFQLIEQGIAGYLALTLSTGSITLSATDGSSDQARNAVLQFNGTLSGACQVVIPNENKVYIVNNATSGAFTVSIQTATPTVGPPSGVCVVPQGTITVVYCDGNNNVIASTNSTLNGVAATFYTRMDPSVNATTPGTAPSNANSNQNSFPFFGLGYASSIVFNAANGNNFFVTLTGNATLAAPTNALDGQSCTLWIQQDSTGGRSLSFAAAYLFPNGPPTVIDQSANALTRVDMVYIGGLASWFCVISYGWTAAGGPGNAYVISENTHNFSLTAMMGGTPSAAVNVFVYVMRGVIVSSLTTQVPALDLSGMPAGSVITLANYGYIQGRGGTGGDGGESAFGDGNFAYFRPATNGTTGGTAMQASGAGTTTNIINLAGNIWGGGGGGGGGGCAFPSTGSADCANGGGGGAGAGGGVQGKGGRGANWNASTSTLAIGIDGSESALGLGTGSAAYGAGGAGNSSGSGTAGENGGNGGDWGTAGNDGGIATGTVVVAAGTGGAAGTAVYLNSSTVNYLSGGTYPNIRGAH